MMHPVEARPNSSPSSPAPCCAAGGLLRGLQEAARAAAGVEGHQLAREPRGAGCGAVEPAREAHGAAQ